MNELYYIMLKLFLVCVMLILIWFIIEAYEKIKEWVKNKWVKKEEQK